jgi:hypothetical protein
MRPISSFKQHTTTLSFDGILPIAMVWHSYAFWDSNGSMIMVASTDKMSGLASEPQI